MRVRFTRLLSVAAVLMALLISPSTASAQVAGHELWSDVDDAVLKTTLSRDVTPERYRAVAVDAVALAKVLAAAPLESRAEFAGEVVLSLPLPDGA